MKWYINRLKVMSIKEILFYRIPQALSKIFYSVLPLKSKPLVPREELFESSFFEISEDLNRYSFFDLYLNLSDIEDWNFDYKNNIKAINNKSYKIKRQDLESYGDVKYVSEISDHFYHIMQLSIILQMINHF